MDREKLWPRGHVGLHLEFRAVKSLIAVLQGGSAAAGERWKLVLKRLAADAPVTDHQPRKIPSRPEDAVVKSTVRARWYSTMTAFTLDGYTVVGTHDARNRCILRARLENWEVEVN